MGGGGGGGVSYLVWRARFSQNVKQDVNMCCFFMKSWWLSLACLYLGGKKSILLRWCYFIFSSSAATSLIDPLLHCCSQHTCVYYSSVVYAPVLIFGCINWLTQKLLIQTCHDVFLSFVNYVFQVKDIVLMNILYVCASLQAVLSERCEKSK